MESGPHVTISDLDLGITYFFDKDDKTYRKIIATKPSENQNKARPLPMSLELTGDLRAGTSPVKVGKYSTERYIGTFSLLLRSQAPPATEPKDIPSLPLKLALNFKSCQTLQIGAKVQDSGLQGILKHLTDAMTPPMNTLFGSLLWQNATVQTELSRAHGFPLTLRLELTAREGKLQLLPPDKPLIYEAQVESLSEAPLADSLFQVPEGRTQV